MNVFSKATSSFVRQIEADPDGSLIHVPNLNDSQKLVPMAVVVKLNRYWPWQRPKYQPSDFIFGDLLQGDIPLKPVVSESDFLSYQGTYWDRTVGSLSATASTVSVDLEGAGSSKLKLSFGKLKKQQVNVKKLLHDCSDRLVDMNHCLVQQVQKRNHVLAVLKERVITTTPCAITETHKKQSSCGGRLNLMGMLGRTVEISVKDSFSLEVDRDISLEIPSQTIIAYSLLELEIEKDGNFKLCLQPHTSGGFGADSGTSSPSHDTIDHQGVVNGIDKSKIHTPERALLSALNSELQKHEGYLCLLAELPVRRDLFKMLMKSLEDRNKLTLQEQALADWCGRADALESQPHSTNSPSRDLLDLLCLVPALQSENGSPAECSPPPQLTAVHLLVSAMEALPDETLSLLAQCSPEILQAIDELICQLRGSCHPLPVNSVPAILLEDRNTWMLLEQLLRSSSVTLERANDELRAETGSEKGDLPLILCLTLRGLSSLCNARCAIPRMWVEDPKSTNGWPTQQSRQL
ncbi:unnamed protein product [Lota lota]